MAPSGFEPAVPARGRPKTHPLDRAATGFGTHPPIWWVFGLRWQEREASQILRAGGVMRVRKSLHAPAGLAFYSGANWLLIGWPSVETYKASTQIIIIIIIIIIIVVIVRKWMMFIHIHFPIHAFSYRQRNNFALC